VLIFCGVFSNALGSDIKEIKRIPLMDNDGKRVETAASFLNCHRLVALSSICRTHLQFHTKTRVIVLYAHLIISVLRRLQVLAQLLLKAFQVGKSISTI
jgi:hypothetical protein